ncbi:MAG: universal stress protein [Gammaproteobacteria bacterium]|nr:universal stress protein [Gammaproteobacteria bacterium]
MAYKHILIATDLSPECHLVLEPATKLHQSLGCKLSLVHVIEPLSMSFGADVPIDLGVLQEQQTRQADERLAEVLPDWPALQREDCHLRYGQPRAEIHQLAEEIGCDLILVGSHGRHGLALLLGSTASDLLSAAPCDVLAVNLKKD